jgi:hypothetical protein
MAICTAVMANDLLLQLHRYSGSLVAIGVDCMLLLCSTVELAADVSMPVATNSFSK